MSRVALLIAFGALVSACTPYQHIPVAEPMAYVVANNELKRGHYEKAATGFSEFLASTNERTYRPRAYYKLAQAEYALGNYDEALDALDELERKFPEEHWFAAAVLQGDSNEALGNRVDAVLYWESVWGIATPEERPLLRTRIEKSVGEATEEEQRELALLLTEPAVLDLLPPGLVVAPLPATIAETATEADAEARAAQADPEDDSTIEGDVSELTATEMGDSAYVAGKRVDAVLFWEIAWSESDRADRELLRPRLDRVASEASEEDIHALGQLLTQPEVVEMFTEVRVTTDSNDIASTEGDTTDVTVTGEVDTRNVATANLAAFPEAFRVGCVLPLTGPDRDMGQRTLSGLRLAFSNAPGALAVRDSGGDPAIAAAVATDLAADPAVLAAVGLLRDPTARAVAPVVDDLALPFLLLEQGEDISGRYLIPAGLPIARPTGAIVTYARQHLAARRFAVVYPDNEYGRNYRDTFLAEVRQQGAAVVGTSPYDAGSHDVSAQGEKIREWMGEGGVEAVFIPDTAAGAAPVAVEIRNAEPTIILLGTESWNDPAALAASAAAVEGAVFSDYFFADSVTPAAQLFSSRFHGTRGTGPTTLEARAFDVAMLLRQSIESGAQSREEVLANMRTSRTYEGAGRIRSSPEGLQRDVFLLRVHQGRVEQVAAYDG